MPAANLLQHRIASETTRTLVLGIIMVGLSRPSSLAQEGAVRGVHDPCIIKEGDTYYLFSTGPGIPVRRSQDLYHWERADRVFEANPDWFSQEVPGSRGAWAPDIAFFEGTYHLYYSVSTYGSNHSCIGLATNQTLDPSHPEYEWVDHGPVLRSTRRDNFNAIDPNVVLDERQEPWLAFGSFWSGIKLTRLDAGTGKPAEPSRLISLASRPRPGAVEAPFLVRRDGFYYLFASFDECCKGVNSTYNIVVGRSKDLAGPYLDREGRPMTDGGGTRILGTSGRVRGPGPPARRRRERGAPNQALGRSRGGFSTKIHVATDDLGNPTRFLLSGGQAADISYAEPLIEGQHFDAGIGDKGYDSDRLVAVIESQGAKAVIPSKKNRKSPRAYDQHLYKERNKVERLVSLIKQYRRVATRYEKTAVNFLGFIHVAAIMVLLR